jgi:hypothetical protein
MRVAVFTYLSIRRTTQRERHAASNPSHQHGYTNQPLNQERIRQARRTMLIPTVSHNSSAEGRSALSRRQRQSRRAATTIDYRFEDRKIAGELRVDLSANC